MLGIGVIFGDGIGDDGGVSGMTVIPSSCDGVSGCLLLCSSASTSSCGGVSGKSER